MKMWMLVVLVLVVAVLGLSGVFTAPPPDPEPTIAPGAAPADGLGTLIVTAIAPEDASGRVAFALYDTEPAFQGKTPPLRKGFVDLDAQGRATWRIEGLPSAAYAVKAFHDANINGELDKGPMGIPTEPYGFSRNARGRFGPPAYADARFTLGSELALEVRLVK